VSPKLEVDRRMEGPALAAGPTNLHSDYLRAEQIKDRTPQHSYNAQYDAEGNDGEATTVPPWANGGLERAVVVRLPSSWVSL
jgi:hypothetical protein